MLLLRFGQYNIPNVLVEVFYLVLLTIALRGLVLMIKIKQTTTLRKCSSSRSVRNTASPYPSVNQESESSQRGATLVEAAIAIPLFLSVVFVGIEVMRFAHATLASQVALNLVARQSSIGTCPPAGSGFDCSRTGRAAFIVSRIQKVAGNYGLYIAADELSVLPQGAAYPGSPNDAGLPRQLIIFRADHEIRIFGGMGDFRIRSLAIIKNEPFAIS